MYGYEYGYNASSLESLAEAGQGFAIWTVIAGILALVGGIVAYFLFVKPKKTWNNKFLDGLKDFFRFNKMWIEGLLKVLYLIAAVFLTLWSFGFLGMGWSGVLSFFMILIFGNIGLRIVYEFMLMTIMIWRNTTDINKKMK